MVLYRGPALDLESVTVAVAQRAVSPDVLDIAIPTAAHLGGNAGITWTTLGAQSIDAVIGIAVVHLVPCASAGLKHAIAVEISLFKEDCSMLTKRSLHLRLLPLTTFGTGTAAIGIGLITGLAARQPDGIMWLFALLVLSAGVVGIAQQTLP